MRTHPRQFPRRKERSVRKPGCGRRSPSSCLSQLVTKPLPPPNRLTRPLLPENLSLLPPQLPVVMHEHDANEESPSPWIERANERAYGMRTWPTNPRSRKRTKHCISAIIRSIIEKEDFVEHVPPSDLPSHSSSVG